MADTSRGAGGVSATDATAAFGRRARTPPGTSGSPIKMHDSEMPPEAATPPSKSPEPRITPGEARIIAALERIADALERFADGTGASAGADDDALADLLGREG